VSQLQEEVEQLKAIITHQENGALMFHFCKRYVNLNLCSVLDAQSPARTWTPSMNSSMTFQYPQSIENRPSPERHIQGYLVRYNSPRSQDVDNQSEFAQTDASIHCVATASANSATTETWTEHPSSQLF